MDRLPAISLVGNLQLTESEEQSVQYISTYDLSHIQARLINKKILDEAIIEEAIVEYRKFMILTRLSTRIGVSGSLPMYSAEVDEVWHTHILFTRDYASFCERAFGEFAHHNPTVGEVSIDESLAASLKFLKAYTKVFASLSTLWNIGGEAGAIMDFLEAAKQDETILAKLQVAFPEFTNTLIQ